MWLFPYWYICEVSAKIVKLKNSGDHKNHDANHFKKSELDSEPETPGLNNIEAYKNSDLTDANVLVMHSKNPGVSVGAKINPMFGKDNV